MKLKVRLLNGRDLDLTPSSGTTLEQLRETIREQTNIAIDRQRLIYQVGWRRLSQTNSEKFCFFDEMYLEYHIIEEAISLSFRLFLEQGNHSPSMYK